MDNLENELFAALDHNDWTKAQVLAIVLQARQTQRIADALESFPRGHRDEILVGIRN